MSIDSLTETFSNLYGAGPDWITSAPGRINLIGEHIDYLEGTVMPAAIDRSLSMTVRSNDTNDVRVWSPEKCGATPVTFSLSTLMPFDGELSWLNYIGGVIEMLRRDGIEPVGFDAVIHADLPSGAGLSSSAALETATALAVESLTGRSLDPVRRAELCQRAEHEFAGVPCGIMDQIAVGLGRKDHALVLDCRDSSYSSIEIPEGVAIVISDTRVTHSLGDGEYRKRREECDCALEILGRPEWRDATLTDIDTKEGELGPLLYRRSRHVVSEMSRVSEMKNAFADRDLANIAEIMRAGHESLRDDFEVSCPELDLLVEAAYKFGTDRGLIGARMTGGGFGGTSISLVREENAEALKSCLEECFREEFHSEPDCFITRTADGASTHAVTCPP